MRLIVAIVVVIVGKIVVHPAAGLLLLEIGLALAKLFLRGGDQAEIMFGVLIIILGGDRISGALRVAGELEIFFGDVGRRSPNFYVLSIGLVHSRQRILVMMATTLVTITTAHAFVLTVSHGLLFRQPRYHATALMPPLLFHPISRTAKFDPRAARRRNALPK